MAVEDVEGDAVRDLQDIELGFFGEDDVEVGFEERVERGDLCADCALGGGFEFGLLGVREPKSWLAGVVNGGGERSFVRFFEHVGRVAGWLMSCLDAGGRARGTAPLCAAG